MLKHEFWDSFEKEAKKKKFNPMLERIRKGLPIKVKGQSLHSMGATRLGRILRKLR